MGNNFGVAWVEIKVDSKALQTGLDTAKKRVATAVTGMEAQSKTIDKKILASKVSLNQQQLRMVNSTNAKILASKKSLNQQQLALEKTVSSQILSSKISLNQQQLAEVQSTNAKILASKKALNQQQLIEDQKRLAAIASLNAKILASKKALNQQRLAEEQKLVASQNALIKSTTANLSRASASLSKVGSFAGVTDKGVPIALKEQTALYDKLSKGMRSAQVMNNEFSKGLRNGRGDLIKTNQSMLSLTAGILKSAPAFAVATAAISGVYLAIRALRDGILNGLSAVESYKTKVATMAAFLTTFADKSQEGGDVAKIYKRADMEAQNLIRTLEVLDRQTIASGKDLTTMAEQFIKSGVSVDLTTKKKRQGFIALANATKLLTAGQNQEIQQRQEIRALLKGELKQSNLVIMALQAKDPAIKKNMESWIKAGTVLDHMGELLNGFIPAARSLEHTWGVIGSSLRTISDVVLRGAMLPVYQDLINLAIKIQDSLVDANNQLTPLAKNIQKNIREAWVNIKGFFKTIYDNLGLIIDLSKLFFKGWLAFKFGSIAAGIISGFSEISKKIAGATTKLKVFKLLASTPITLTIAIIGIGLLREAFSKIKELRDKENKAALKEGKISALGGNILSSSDYMSPEEKAAIAASGYRNAGEAARAAGEELPKKYIPKSPLNLITGAGGAEEKKAIEDRQKALKDFYDVKGLLDKDAFENEKLLVMQKADLLAKNLGNTRNAYEKAAEYEVLLMKELFDKRQIVIEENERIEKERIKKLEDTGVLFGPQTLKDAEANLGLLGQQVVSYVEDINKITEAEDKAKRKLEEMGKVSTIVAGEFKDNFTDAILSLKDGFAGLGDFAIGVLNSIARQMIQTNISEPLAKGLGSFNWGSLFSSASAKGNAFSNGTIQAYATGGIVDSPTAFSTKTGMGIAGEAGTEAILPLKRTASGDLGVQTTGSKSSSNKEMPPIILQYSPVINAIDTQSGLQFLSSHSRVITGMVDQAYNKIGKRGIR